MRYFHSFCAVFIMQLSVLQAQKIIARPQVYALVVGVTRYNDGRIPNLKYAEKDAIAFADFLKTPNAGAIPDQNIVLLTNEKATRSNILRELVQLISRSSKEDLLIFYFSGHGKNDILENSGYLLSYDTENDNEAGSAMSMDDIKSKIDRSPAKMKVSYIDACHAGLFKSTGAKGTAVDNGEIVKAYMQGLANASDGNVAFLASSARQQSLEDEKLGHGIFTYYLIKGLQGEADKEQKEGQGFNNGVITVSEMETYLSNKIQAATKYLQKPSVDGIYDEDFPLSILSSNLSLSTEIAKRPKKAKPAPVTTPAASEPPKTRLETATLEMLPGKCNDGHDVYGELCFINNYNEDVLLYTYYNGGLIKPNLLLAKGEKTSLGRVKIAFSSKVIASKDIKFYFKTVDESKPLRFGTLTLNVETCKIKTEVLSNKNLYLSVNGEKRQ